MFEKMKMGVVKSIMKTMLPQKGKAMNMLAEYLGSFPVNHDKGEIRNGLVANVVEGPDGELDLQIVVTSLCLEKNRVFLGTEHKIFTASEFIEQAQDLEKMVKDVSEDTPVQGVVTTETLEDEIHEQQQVEEVIEEEAIDAEEIISEAAEVIQSPEDQVAEHLKGSQIVESRE